MIFPDLLDFFHGQRHFVEISHTKGTTYNVKRSKAPKGHKYLFYNSKDAERGSKESPYKVDVYYQLHQTAMFVI